jgi:hypothetical protein
MVALIILGALIVLSVLSVAYGVDSRDGSSDPRRGAYPVGLR